MIDVLRATSTIVTALAAGATAVRAVDTVEEAEALRHADPRRLLGGERHLKPLPSFDFGNSPASYLSPQVRDRELILSTTNGTRALAWAAATKARVLALALLNVSAVASTLLDPAPAHVLLLCAGVQGRIGWDDAYVAGALLERLISAGLTVDLGETAQVVHWLYMGASTGTTPFDALAATDPGQQLIAAGYRADVEFCARRDAFDVVPVWSADGVLRADAGRAG